MTPSHKYVQRVHPRVPLHLLDIQADIIRQPPLMVMARETTILSQNEANKRILMEHEKKKVGIPLGFYVLIVLLEVSNVFSSSFYHSMISI
jgi:hypothetical protein